MRLEASGLRCIRGGREVFSGVGFALGDGEALLVTGRNGAGKSSLLRMIAGLVRIASGRVALAGGSAEATLAEQAHYLGHQDAQKPSLTVAENLAFWARYLGGGEPSRRGAGDRRARGAGGRAGGLSVGWTAASGFRSPGCWRSGGRSGCWTSRPRRSTRMLRTCSRVSCGNISLAADCSWQRHTGRSDSNAPRSCGSEAPHDLARRVVRARSSSCGPYRRWWRHWRAVFFDRHRADAVCDWPGHGVARPYRAGDSLARRIARQSSDAGSIVRGRSRGRLARSDPDG